MKHKRTIPAIKDALSGNNKKSIMSAEEKQRLTSNLLIILSKHVGYANRIGMGELYVKVFGKDWEHRINDTRPLRSLITQLRKNGVAICSVAKSKGGGYYIASADSELRDYLKRVRAAGLRKLIMEAKIRKVSLPELLGQIRIDLLNTEEGADGR